MKKIELVLWFRCNSRCRFCVVDSATARQSMETGAAIRHLERARTEGAVAVDFGGGEPTLRDDLPELARTAKALGYTSIGVKSNGLRLCYPEVVDALLRAGVDRFTLPVWGASPRTHDGLSQTAGSFEMLEMAVKHIIDLGGGIELDVLLTTLTVPELGMLIRPFADLGVRRFSIWLYCMFGSNGTFPEFLPTLTAAGLAVAQTAAALKKNELVLSTSHIPPCFLSDAAGLYSSIADAGLVIVTPGGSFPAETSPFEAGMKTVRCSGCIDSGRCAGIRPEYIHRFSDGEVRPVGQTASSAPSAHGKSR
ncbi:MAG: radical SAM protein [Elusimicrobiota bacterium]